MIQFLNDHLTALYHPQHINHPYVYAYLGSYIRPGDLEHLCWMTVKQLFSHQYKDTAVNRRILSLYWANGELIIDYAICPEKNADPIEIEFRNNVTTTELAEYLTEGADFLIQHTRLIVSNCEYFDVSRKLYEDSRNRVLEIASNTDHSFDHDGWGMSS